MNTFLYFEINAFSIIISALIFLNLYHKTNTNTKEQSLFLSILMSNISILIFDSFMCVFDGKNTQFYKIALLISTLFYFLLQPLICMHLFYYVDYQINHKNERLKKFWLPVTIPVIVNTILSFLSLFNNLFFYFDQNNVYHRGQYFLALPLISFSYLLFIFINLMKSRRRITGTYFRSFLSFIFWPTAGALMQFLFYGLPLIFTGMTISILIVYINIQNQQMYHDYLTGLYNRRQLDLYLQSFSQKNKAKIAGILLDINSFKSINDQFGHSTGDEALKYTADLLKNSFGYNSFISRLGGDEFVILFEANNRSDLSKAVIRLRKNASQYNQAKSLPYELNFSIGADIYNPETRMTGQEFLDHIDSLMYQEKKAK
jgi:diguanylate cyclase (GGDEF)-like protein